MTTHDHHHDHEHDHSTLPDAAERLGYYQRMEIAVRELLIAKGIVTADAIRAAIEAMDARSPAEVAAFLRSQEYEPVWKDWDPTYDGMAGAARR